MSLTNNETDFGDGKQELSSGDAGNTAHDAGDNVELHHEDPTPITDEVDSNYNKESERGGKRHRDSDDDDRNGKRDSSFGSAAPKRARSTRSDERLEIRLLIPTNTAGALIGKGGQNIRELRQEFNANIQLPDSQGYERIVTAVTSGMDDLCNFVGKAAKCLNERMHPREDCSIRMLIHKSQAGTIIGIKGTRIRELRESTGALIKVNQECCPGSTDRICQISGPQDILVKCVRTVMELLGTAPPKGHVQNYDPSCVDDSYNYGGFNGFDPECPFDQVRRRNPGGRDHPGGFDMAPNFRRGGGGRGRYDDGDFDGGDYGRRRMGGNNMGRMGGRYPPDRPMRRGPRMGGGPGPMRRPGRMSYGGDFAEDTGFGADFDEGPAGPGFNDAGGSGGNNFNDSGDGKRESTQVTIPTVLAGSIIGVRGQRIRQIRQDSGANIKIEEELPGTKERIITIIGNAEQIQNAQYLLQKSVKLYSGERF